VVGNEPSCQPTVPGAAAPGNGAFGSGRARHETALGSSPNLVADVENQTNQQVPDLDLAARVTLPDPSGPSAPPTFPVAPLTSEADVDGPAMTPKGPKSMPDNPPLAMASSSMLCIAFESADCAWTS
jgi:hypothetical protein